MRAAAQAHVPRRTLAAVAAATVSAAFRCMHVDPAAPADVAAGQPEAATWVVAAACKSAPADVRTARAAARKRRKLARKARTVAAKAGRTEEPMEVEAPPGGVVPASTPAGPLPAHGEGAGEPFEPHDGVADQVMGESGGAVASVTLVAQPVEVPAAGAHATVPEVPSKATSLVQFSIGDEIVVTHEPYDGAVGVVASIQTAGVIVTVSEEVHLAEMIVVPHGQLRKASDVSLQQPPSNARARGSRRSR